MFERCKLFVSPKIPLRSNKLTPLQDNFKFSPYLSVIRHCLDQPIACRHPERENWCLIKVYQSTRVINIFLKRY